MLSSFGIHYLSRILDLIDVRTTTRIASHSSWLKNVILNRTCTCSINKEGGCGRITHIHYSEDGVHVEALDVKYVLTGRTDASIDPAIVSAFNTLQRGGRKRRGRDFLMEMEQPQPQQAQENKPPAASKKKKATTSDNKEALATTKAASKPSVKKQKNDSKAPKSTIRKQSTTTKEVKKSATAKRRIVPVAAAESSPRSTATEESSSTPPSKKRTTKAKKATPIPSLVIADPGKIQVSPLPVHGERPTVAKKKKTNNNDLSSSSTTTNNKVVAKRGLFGSGHNSKNKNTNKEAGAQGHQLQRKKSTSSKGVSVTAAAKKPLATEIGDGDDGDSLFEDIARMQRKNPVVHHSNDRSKNNKKKLPPNKKPRPPKQTNKSANDMPLKEVYDDEVKKASSFVKGVIQSSSTSNNTSRPIAVTTAKENNVGKSKNKIDDPVKKPPIL